MLPRNEERGISSETRSALKILSQMLSQRGQASLLRHGFPVPSAEVVRAEKEYLDSRTGEWFDDARRFYSSFISVHYEALTRGRMMPSNYRSGQWLREWGDQLRERASEWAERQGNEESPVSETGG